MSIFARTTVARVATARIARLGLLAWLLIAGGQRGVFVTGAPAAESAAAAGEMPLTQRRALRIKQLPAPPALPATAGLGGQPIDRFIAARWAEVSDRGPEPVASDDATFVRRVYLDLIGLIPTLVETNRFLADSTADKRARLVDHLLSRSADYAAHWTPYWEDALASQTVVSQGGIPTRGDYRQWIFDSFAANKPYDLLVAELIDPTLPGRKPGSNEDLFGTKYHVAYVRNEDHTATLQTAANIGQVFLASSMKCASCHDHFEKPEWTQERFLGFAGFFTHADLERIRCDVHSKAFVSAKFPFDIPGEPIDAPAELDARLHRAAQLITDPLNPRFARTIVNRLWKRYLGLGLFEPADDYRSEAAVSHPQLLDWLAHDFLSHGCDLRHTVREIVNSRTYQLRYDPGLEDRFDPAEPQRPRFFRSPALRRLTAEQFLDSVRLATEGKLAAADRTYLDSRSTVLMRALGKPSSRNEISTARPDDVAVVQSLELLNGAELHDLIHDSVMVARPGKLEPRRQVDRLYRTLLSRPATPEEKRLGQALLQAADSPGEGIEDFCWTLVCSPEFQYIK